MDPIMIRHLRTLLAHPDRPDRDALFYVLIFEQASTVLACLAPPGSLAQIAAALRSEWSWDGDGWERLTDDLVSLITGPRCPRPNLMLETWSRIPNAVGVLRNRTNALVTWAHQRLGMAWYDDLAILLGPSNASARLLVQSPSSDDIGKTLRRWSMATDSTDPTAWQVMIDADLRAVVREKADPSTAFPAWGGDDAVNPDDVLTGIVDDLVTGWSPDHPSIRGRIAWLEHHVGSNLHVGNLALVASIGKSDVLAEAVCARLGHDPSAMYRIADKIPWSRLHLRIQTVIDETMRQSFDDGWKRTWACAFGLTPIMPDNDIDAFLLLWRIAPERWNDLDPSIRAALVSSISFLPHHCYGWGAHPDLVAKMYCQDSRDFRYWNPDVSPDDLLAWKYGDLLRLQSTLQDARGLITLLHVLPSNRRARFKPIIDGRLGGRSKPTAQPPWEWTTWASLPATDRQKRLRAWLRVLWEDRVTSPAVWVWQNRSDPVANVAVAGLDLPDRSRAPRILAALLAQVPALRVHMPNPGPRIPFPNDLDAVRRAQIKRLPLDRDTQAYAAWCFWLLARDVDVGADLLALHPDVAVALVPFLSPAQQKAVAASPAAQEWESMTHLRWVASCAPAQEQPVPPIPRRIR